MPLSQKSQEFIENLRLYLFSCGKKSAEIEEIVQELKDHLTEAEKNGKSIENITGQSPQAYMETIAKEMPSDYAGWAKMLPLVMSGAFAYVLLGDVIHGTLNYSLYALIGYPATYLLLFILITVFFQFLAKKNPGKKVELSLFGAISLLSTLLFIGILWLDRFAGSPVVEVEGMIGKGIGAAIACLIFIGISVWSKTWLSIIIPAMLYLPELAAKWMPGESITKILAPTLCSYFLIFIFLIFQFRRQTRNTKNG
ncbi:hypothetical protein SAMN04488137_0656 [Fictibacillus solisalsi]|uniref:HAAS transmembrane region domain-containing protein n=1 Tax=Fictibacillus solisalsi TaxID=459525 RepID=A0A1G9U2N9_9BACL|nr:hypothetical protein [Fictibacillus solisalsi]SDM54178.1 hypothetical protein SAMN04488137_0656 [Fictibacillus solisalsi]